MITKKINPEQPVTWNTAVLFCEQHSSMDEQAEVMRQRILDATNEVKPATITATYYVSHHGDDANDGMTPATAWRSTKHVGEVAETLQPGSTVLFERGGVYRGMMFLRTGMTVGAYGTGPKPQLYGSWRDFADESLWQPTDKEHVWCLAHGAEYGDVGNIIFDYGKEMASLGKVRSMEEIQKDLDFYCDAESGNVYLYLSKGNPAAVYTSIEIAARGTGAIFRRYVPDGLIENVTIDNVCMRYANFGVSLGVSSNITIKNCEIGYMGGCMHTEKVRFGNGIELYGSQNDITIKNNWIYQCFDAGYTNQGGKIHERIVVSDNLIEYCHYNIEVFVDEGVVDSVIENNILRFPGYGFGSYNRMSSGTHQGGNIRTGTKGVPSKNFVVRDNIFDGGQHNIVYLGRLSGENCPTFSGNTWIQTGNNPVLTHWIDEVGYNKIDGGSLQAMNDAILPLDPTAKIIYE